MIRTTGLSDCELGGLENCGRGGEMEPLGRRDI